MKAFLKEFAVFSVVTSCVSGFLTLPAAADSTADLVLNLRCNGGYNVQIWRNRASGTLQYRSQSPLGNLSLEAGTARATEGVQVYEFQNGNYRYAVWDGTLDSSDEGTLEVYQNNYILMQQPCRKV